MQYPAFKTSLVTGLTALTCLVWSGPSHGGGITSANAPEIPPPPKVPGTARLSCEIRLGKIEDFYKPRVGTAGEFSSQKTTVEYEKREGDMYFSCTDGCESPVWTSSKPLSPIRLLKIPQKLTDLSLPSLRVELMNGVPYIIAKVKAGHISDSGTLIQAEKETYRPLNSGRELFFIAETNEETLADRTQLDELYAKTNRPVKTKIYGYTEVRCERLEPGTLSKTEIARLRAQAPRPGFISANEYESKVQGQLKMPFRARLSLALKLDPDHLRALLASSSINKKSELDAIKAILPEVRRILAAYPDLTFENIWAVSTELLKIPAMSPTGIVVGSLIPLVMASEGLEAATK
jgi:hypothetical protein